MGPFLLVILYLVGEFILQRLSYFYKQSLIAYELRCFINLGD